jgi:hypothetical protein
MGSRSSFAKAFFLGSLFATLSASAIEHKAKSLSATTDSPHADLPDRRGTSDEPLVIRLTPQPADPEKSAQNQHDSEVKEKNDALLTEYTANLASWTKVLALLTAGLVAAALVQIIMFFRQLRVMKLDLEDTKIVAEAAKESANTARESLAVERQTMISSGRAYVQTAGMRWISHRIDGTNDVFWRLRLRWRNAGNTPTRNLRVIFRYELRDTPYPDDYHYPVEFPTPMPPTTLPPNGEFESGFFDVNGDDLQLVKQGNRHLYAWGSAEYNDVYPETPRHTTKVCSKATIVTGEPTKYWHDKDNIVEILWGQIAGQNFTDDDGAPKA